MPRPLPIDMAKVRELHAQGLTCRQIAERLGVNYGTMRWRTGRAGLRFKIRGAKRGPLPARCPKRGHDLTLPGAVSERDRCVECRREADRERYHRDKPASPRARKPKAQPVGADSLEAIRTRRILDLAWEREHAPHWLKPAYTQRIEALRA